jgi:hypothetical protein
LVAVALVVLALLYLSDNVLVVAALVVLEQLRVYQ